MPGLRLPLSLGRICLLIITVMTRAPILFLLPRLIAVGPHWPTDASANTLMPLLLQSAKRARSRNHSKAPFTDAPLLCTTLFDQTQSRQD